MPTVVQRLGADHLYRTTGLQLLPFNTLRRTQPLRRYQPAGDPTAWRAAAQRVGIADPQASVAR